ncbi:MAG: DUF6452 family protein [Maribacter sp.]|nr:DUF6452 family protein [Maribacter sp.]
MNKIHLLILILVALLAFSACEKDDICVDGDTPLLVIRFYDVSDTTLVKTVPGLEVRGLFTPDSVLNTIPNASLDSIAIPLRVDSINTSFIFSEKLSDDDPVNNDTLLFTYSNKQVYISRACGYVANYENLSSSLTGDAANWIKKITIDTLLIANSISAHVKIYH